MDRSLARGQKSCHVRRETIEPTMTRRLSQRPPTRTMCSRRFEVVREQCKSLSGDNNNIVKSHEWGNYTSYVVVVSVYIADRAIDACGTPEVFTVLFRSEPIALYNARVKLRHGVVTTATTENPLWDWLAMSANQSNGDSIFFQRYFPSSKLVSSPKSVTWSPSVCVRAHIYVVILS